MLKFDFSTSCISNDIYFFAVMLWRNIDLNIKI